MKTRFSKVQYLLFTLLLFVSILQGYAQVSISGVVTDKKDGMPLPGVTIMLKGTQAGTITNIDGEFTLSADANATLVFSYVGFASVEVALEGRTSLNIQLEESYLEIGEVITIGYGTQKKSDKTGAVANIDADELNYGVATDPIQGIQGKSAGVSVTKKGGDPNTGFSVKIRGSSGLYSGTDPLYVVDGVPGVDPTTIAADDIESYNILKDASSTAIYGSRGANGVIIITTKKGSYKRPNTVEFNSYVSMDQVANRLDLLSADELRQYAIDNSLTFNDGEADTDWQDEIFRTGLSQSYNLAASGGGQNSAYRVSVTHVDFKGVVIGSQKERTVGRINMSQKAINDKLQIQASIAGTFEQNEYIQYSGSGPNDVLYQAYQRNPTDPVKNEDGSYYEIQRDFNYYNPVALANDIQNERDAKRFLGNMRMDFEIISGLTAGVNLAYTRDDSESFYFEPSYVRGSTSTGYGRRGYGNFSQKILETTLTYNTSINEVHNLNLVGGYSFQQDNYDGFSAQGTEPLSDYVMSHNLGVLNNVKVGDIASYKGSNRLISFFGRAVYNYDSRYYFTATVRRDGSSRFGDNNEWGWFPSASLAWNLKRESFLENVSVLEQLKLRLGFGLSGNQEIGNYNDIVAAVPSGPTINPETGEDAILFQMSHNANPDLKWEENSELNIGVDFGFFSNRLSGSLEYYNKTTYDLIAPYAVPVPPNSVPTTWANAGKISNQGFEAFIQGFIFNERNFDWKSSIVFSTNKQKVISLSNDDYEWTEGDKKQGWLSGRGLVGDENWTQLVEEGYELGTYYMPEYAGLSSDGKFLFYTEAGGVTRNVADAERRVVGHALPDFELGWSNYFTLYKNFDISFVLRAVVGSDVLNVTRMVFANPTVLPSLNGLAEVLDEVERGVDDFPKVNSYYLEDGSFLKLDNLTVGYNFDITTIDWLQKLRVYVVGNNLLTLTRYTGIDPEISYNGLSFGLDQYNTYPKVRSFTMGVNVTF
ncbi:MAG: SusC/RagA family TonB-linked outer membrane protein [Bacteroidota bacterium]|nr:SusC/RagA family TonB-linked outer membrane protein [Bacteroidota bacterium]